LGAFAEELAVFCGGTGGVVCWAVSNKRVRAATADKRLIEMRFAGPGHVGGDSDMVESPTFVRNYERRIQSRLLALAYGLFTVILPEPKSNSSRRE